MNASGAWQSLRLHSTVTAPGATVLSFATVTYITPTTAVPNAIMPSPSVSKVLSIRNLSSSVALSMTGPFEGGAGAFSIAAKNTVTFHSDGTYWYPISKYSA